MTSEDRDKLIRHNEWIVVGAMVGIAIVLFVSALTAYIFLKALTPWLGW